MNKKYFFSAAATGSFFLIIFIYSFWLSAVSRIEAATAISVSRLKPRDSTEVREAMDKLKPPRRTVKAIYLTAYSASNSKKVTEILDLIRRTELNAVVIDIKDYSGTVLYESRVPLAVKLNLSKNILGDIRGTIDRFHKEDVYVIARQTVFQDPLLATRMPEYAMRDIDGGLWRDRKGLAWVDPTKRAVWDYNLQIAEEVSHLGFDEINFDYVRFPSDGNLRRAVYDLSGHKLYENMGRFFSYLDKETKHMRVWTSVDLFGFVMERGGEDDLQIGQRLEDVLSHVDYISPMMYPSHYPAGHLGLMNPAAFPEQVINYGIEKGLPRFNGQRAKFRPWLQAFDLGAVYDGTKIQMQINSVERASSDGWLLWNASNRYTDAGLKSS